MMTPVTLLKLAGANMDERMAKGCVSSAYYHSLYVDRATHDLNEDVDIFIDRTERY